MNIVIAGEGKEIHFLIKTFISQGHHVVFINNNEEQCKKFARLHEEIDVVLGDPYKTGSFGRCRDRLCSCGNITYEL